MSDNNIHGVKGVRIRSYSGSHFSAFGLNTERYRVSFRIQSECGKMRTRITPNTDTIYAVIARPFLVILRLIWWHIAYIFLLVILGWSVSADTLNFLNFRAQSGKQILRWYKSALTCVHLFLNNVFDLTLHPVNDQ